MHQSGTHQKKRKVQFDMRLLVKMPSSCLFDHRPPLRSWSSSTSWLLFDGEDVLLLQNTTEMKPKMTTDIAMLAEKRILRFAKSSTLLKLSMDDRYQSSEEDLSSGGEEGSEMSIDTYDDDFIAFPDDEDEDEEAYDSFAPSCEIDAHVARIITFIAPGKPRLIDINSFSPVMELRTPVRQSFIKPPEPRIKRRIRESREMDRILKSRSWISNAFGHDEPYVARRSFIPPLDDFGARSLYDGSIPRDVVDTDPFQTPRYSPTKFGGAHLKLRGVARSIITAKRKSSLPEGLW